jgi:hypothetical protein
VPSSRKPSAASQQSKGAFSSKQAQTFQAKQDIKQAAANAERKRRHEAVRARYESDKAEHLRQQRKCSSCNWIHDSQGRSSLIACSKCCERERKIKEKRDRGLE